MPDWFSIKETKQRVVNWLALDSWIDSSIYDFIEGLKAKWNAYSDFMGRFHLSGFKRVLAEIASEGFTIFAIGIGFLLMLAMPAFQETQSNWRDPGEFSVTFLDRYGNEIGKRGILHDDAVPLKEIPDHMIKATLATEDRRFYEHYGIDLYGTFRAIMENAKSNSTVQGGSSITQQLAKNLFLSSEQTLKRKIKEAFLALWLEFHFTKDEILKLYLDRAYMGAGAYGVEAAARVYFNKSIRDVTLAESAILAGIYKAPSTYAPHINLPNSRARANEVLTNMVQAGFLTEAQVHGARLNPAQIADKPDFYSPDYFLDWAFDEVKSAVGTGQDYVLTARSTVDINLQKFAQNVITSLVQQNKASYDVDEGAMVAMELDGAVRAIVGGKDYEQSQFSRATKAMRQPGSSFKTYVYMTALENGYSPKSVEVDGFVQCGRWSPKNYDGGFHGAMNLATALMKSINTIAVKLSLKVGREKVLADLKKIGLGHIRKSCSMALGDSGVTVLQHTAGYATFANGGKYTKPYGILDIRNSKGEIIYTHEKDGPKPKQIFDRKHVEELNSMLELVVTSGTGQRAKLDFTAAVGKTGTSSGYKDAWFVGFTGQYVGGFWFGNDNFQPTNKMTGGSLPAMGWNQFMTYAHSTPNIPQIPGVALHPQQIENMKNIASAPKETENSEIKTVAAPRTAEEQLPKQTETVLKQIVSLLSKAKPVEEGTASASDTNAKIKPAEQTNANSGGDGKTNTTVQPKPADKP